MDERYTNSIIDSTSDYLYRLQYLAQANPIDLKDIMTLDIIHNIYSWADWFELSETVKIKLQNKMNDLILSNSNLVLPAVTSYSQYFNVSIPQTIWTWQRVYDNLIVSEVNYIDPVILGEDGNVIIMENGDISVYENFL